MQLSAEEVQEELRSMAYTSQGFEQVVTFVWALPKCFWSDVCKRLIATILVGVQHPVEPTPKCFKIDYPRE